MVSVSDTFKALAQENGRHVSCKIIAGSEEFLDDRIIEFDLDDVAHPDWFTIGTACSNRFFFKVKYAGELEVRDKVTPYVSFDGEEWCPLGVFYVARRYVRGSYASITCYDGMYSLDTEYESSLALPTDTVSVLREIESLTRLECADYGTEYTVSEIPSGCTVRDMIGYIAGMNRACAKLDRYGALTFRQYSGDEFALDERNCIDISRNMGRSVVTCLKADTGEEQLVSGSGAEISTLEMYNPLMTQTRLDEIYSLFKPFSFYGADIEMQGLPFLESGDKVSLLENGLLYPLVISEIEYHYDGALNAVLYSKNKSYSDAAQREDDLENALEELRALLSAMYYKHSNTNTITLSDTPTVAVDFELEVTGEAFAQVDVNFTADNITADTITVSVYVNDVKAERDAVQTMSGTDSELIHWYFLADKLSSGSSRIYVTLSAQGGSAQIQPQQLIATVVGHGIKGSSDTSTGRITISETVSAVSLCGDGFAAAELSDEYATELTEEE